MVLRSKSVRRVASVVALVGALAGPATGIAEASQSATVGAGQDRTGQTYGEAVVGLYTLGVGGFRIQQPVEVYPVLIVNDEAGFGALRAELLADSTRECAPRRNTLKRFLLPLAPVYLQAILVCPPRREVAFAREARETRRAWRAYKKPKLAERVFTDPHLAALLG